MESLHDFRPMLFDVSRIAKLSARLSAMSFCSASGYPTANSAAPALRASVLDSKTGSSTVEAVPAERFPALNAANPSCRLFNQASLFDSGFLSGTAL